MNIDEQYPYLVSDVMEYIEEIKEVERDSSLLDIISDFCFKNDIEVEMIGDAIASDVYFKSFLEKDCELHRIFRTTKKPLDEW